MITENDKELIRQARQEHYFNWNSILQLENYAESEETRKILRDIAKFKFHQEEESIDHHLW